jgi:hypothetical protein
MAELPGRRRSTRYQCTGGAELRRSESSPGIFGTVTGISLEGCYVETVSTFPPGTELLIMLRVAETVLRGRALVKSSNHAVGMGLEFTHFTSDDQQKLELLLTALAGTIRTQEQLTVLAEEPVRAPTPVSGQPVRTPTRLTTTRPAPTASINMPPRSPVTAPPQATSAAPASTSPVSQKIMRTVSELNDLEQNLVKEQVDPRLIAQLHDAIEHVRQTAWTLQQWIELHATGGDPFAVLPQLEAERMHMLGKLAHNVNADIDATSINEFTLGVSELYESIEGLHRRLQKMLRGGADE